jgi:hypothetical protein
VQVIETRKRVLRDEHPDTLININNLAFTLKGQGSTGRVITLKEDCCALGVAVLDPNIPIPCHLRSSYNIAARGYRTQRE